MQRSGGQADGSDLKKKGLFGRGQGSGSARLDVDDKYDNLEKEGKLRSFAFEVPWSNKQLEEQNRKEREKKLINPFTGVVEHPDGRKTDYETGAPVEEAIALKQSKI